MLAPESDWKFWQWVLGGACTFIAGIMGGTWAARGKYDEMKADIEDNEKRLKKVEEALGAVGEIKADVAYIRGVIDERRTNHQQHYQS